MAVLTAAGARARAAFEGKRWHEMDGRVLKVAESNSMSSAANCGARAGGGGGAAGRGHDRDHCKEPSTVQRLGNIM